MNTQIVSHDVNLSAQVLIENLGLKPHPEGGWYAETFNTSEGENRGTLSVIYYLLEKGQAAH